MAWAVWEVKKSSFLTFLIIFVLDLLIVSLENSGLTLTEKK